MEIANVGIISLVTLICVARDFVLGNMCSGMKRQHVNKYLIGHKIGTLTGVIHTACLHECLSLKACKSVDYIASNATCKLNNADSMSVDPSEFVYLQDAVFSDIELWPRDMVGNCRTRPCAMTQRCSNTQDGYDCTTIVCEYPLLENGNATLLEPNNTKFLAKFRADCNVPYVPSRQENVICLSTSTWDSISCIPDAIDCKDILDKYTDLPSGVYYIYMWESKQIVQVYCDMDTDGGGWTVFQRRFNGTTDFNRRHRDYINGFGSLDDDHWLGLNYIKEIADGNATELRVNLIYASGYTAYEHFQSFLLEGYDFSLRLDNQTVSPDMDVTKTMNQSNGQPFSTFDRYINMNFTNCPDSMQGAWWYDNSLNGCTEVNLNGRYCVSGSDGCMQEDISFYHNGLNRSDQLIGSVMMIRRV